MIAEAMSDDEEGQPKLQALNVRVDEVLLESFRDEVYRRQKADVPPPTLQACVEEALGRWLMQERGLRGGIAPARPWRGLRPGRKA